MCYLRILNSKYVSQVLSISLLLTIATVNNVYSSSSEKKNNDHPLNGKWIVVSYEDDSNHVVGPEAWNYTLHFDGDRISLFKDGEKINSGQVTFNQDNVPSSFDVVYPNGTRVYAIYEVLNGKLMIQSISGKEKEVKKDNRPTEFKATPNNKKQNLNTYVKF